MKFSKLKEPLVASLLSLFLPGLGQAYNGRTLKAVLFVTTPFLFVVFASWLTLLHTFPRMVAVVGVVLGIQLSAVVDAWRDAYEPRFESKPARRWPGYVLLASLLAGQAFFLISPERSGWILRIRGFRLPSNSMAPTLVEGDRIVVDMRAYKEEAPHRGDLVIVELAPRGMFVRRVVGLPGDTASITADGILINEKLLPKPYRQGANPESPKEGQSPSILLESGPKTVQLKEFLVLVDNELYRIYSSLPETGTVSSEQIKGKPLYIYWSDDLSRVGSKLQ